MFAWVCFLANHVCHKGIGAYLLIWPEDGVMRKEDIRGIYDGSIFYRKADEHQANQARVKQQRQKQTVDLGKEAKKLV
jgi:hypothetical protein